ncbi:MAG: recombinase family protein [Alphaproteobacteria bacterium]
MRIALYARFSSDQQNPRSTDDQLALLRIEARRLIAAHGGEIVGEFHDDELSGKFDFNRSDYQRMLAACRAGEVDCVLVEHTDRLARDLESTAGRVKRFKHWGVELRVLGASAPLTAIETLARGLVDQIAIEGLPDKVRRGQRGAVERGRLPGGLPYGYAVAREIGEDGELVRGLRRIDEAQAAVVRRIFAEFAAGKGVKAIVRDLNAEGVPTARGGKWNVSTVAGGAGKGQGILLNETYIGRVHFLKRTYPTDPETGRRESRANARRDWVTIDRPDLRIVDDDLWARAQAARGPASAPGARSRRPRARWLFAGLVFCGVCGAPMTVVSQGRLGCSARANQRTCANAKTMFVSRLERLLLEGLKSRLLAPEVMAEASRAYHARLAELARDKGAERRKAEKALADAQGRVARIVASIEAGADSDALRARLSALEGQARALQDRLAEAPLDDKVVSLFPQMAECWRREIERLQESLAATPALKMKAAGVLRRMVTRIALHPRGRYERMGIELEGSLGAIVEAAMAARDRTVRVAEREGFEPSIRLLIV